MVRRFNGWVSNSMVQSPFWEANSSSATQDTPSILRNPKAHNHIYKSPPPVIILRQIDPVFFEYFITWLLFYCEEMLATRRTPKLEDHHFSAVRDCLFDIFAAAFHIWRPFFHLQPEDAPCRGGRDPLARCHDVVTWTHLSGPSEFNSFKVMLSTICVCVSIVDSNNLRRAEQQFVSIRHGTLYLQL